MNSSFSLDFILKETGKRAENKQASVVMIADWW